MRRQTFINFTLTSSNHILIDCEVNLVLGKFLVDTGASNSCVNYNSASKFNIDFEISNDQVSSATNKISETYHSENNTLKIGDFQKSEIDLMLFDMTFINNSLKEKGLKEVDGIIGSDVLNQLYACINYKKREIGLEF